MQEWFQEWFNSPYYHKLYFKRDDAEANAFIQNLIAHLQPIPNSTALDVACGKGRHSKILNKLGLTVTGIDIAANSIADAKAYEHDTLQFLQHDMRLTYCVNCFDYAFNLFTSFGYFTTSHEHNAAIRTIAQALKPGGILVMDYMNSTYVQAHLIPTEVQVIDGTTYDISRTLENNYFVKKIKVTDNKLVAPMLHQEQVAAFTIANFNAMFQSQGLKIMQTYGSYALDAFDEHTSKRLIMVIQKN